MDEWAATDSPHALFLGLLKSVPGLCELDQIVHVLCALIVEMNGLVCVELDRLRHDFNVLTQ